MKQGELQFKPKRRPLTDTARALYKARIRSTLRRGKANAILSNVIEDRIGIQKSRTAERVRGLIREMLDDGVPIGSCTKGYFLIETAEELHEVLEDLRRREAGIRIRRQRIEEGYRAYCSQGE
jgi:hypothetical protein